MKETCKINSKTVKDSIKSTISKSLIQSKLFKVEEELVTPLYEVADIQTVIDQINKNFGEDIVVPFSTIFRIGDPSDDLIQKYIDYFDKTYAPKPTVAPVSELLKKGQFQGMPEFNKLPYKSDTPTMTYAGIGSRETPKPILEKMVKIAEYLESIGYTLNTGEADGADKAFRNSVKDKNNKNIFTASMSSPTTLAIAEEIHPNWSAVGDKGRSFHARNTHQVFGKNLDKPVDFVLMWTQDGKTGYGKNRPQGGTGQAVEMAVRKGIPVINLANPTWRQELKNILGIKDKVTTQSVADEVYGNLGTKTNSENVNIDNVKGRRPVNNDKIVAYRTRNNNFLEAFREDNAIGNIWGTQGGLYHTDTVKEAVTEFIAWMIGEKHQDIEQDYRASIISEIPNMKGKEILYYKDLQEPSHATALDYLINKYNWENKTIATLEKGNSTQKNAISPIEIKDWTRFTYNGEEYVKGVIEDDSDKDGDNFYLKNSIPIKESEFIQAYNQQQPETLYGKYTGTLSKEEFEALSIKEQETIIEQQNTC